MPPQDDKRLLRKLKKDVKRRGTKRLRQALKQDLTANPEEAHRSEIDYGHLSSETLNGQDRDATRKKKHDD
jgi:hypothetical protein